MEQEKTQALIEEIEDGEVAVYFYDSEGIGSPIEVLHKLVALEKYSVIGEIVVGEIELYSTDDNPELTEDYSEFSNVAEDDND